MKTVFIVITSGFQVRNILYTDIFKKIKEVCNVVILCPSGDVHYFLDEFGGKNVFVEPLLINSKFSQKIERKLGIIRRYILSNPARNKTINVFSMAMKQHSLVKYFFIRIGNQFLGRFRFLRDLFLRIESSIITGHEYAPLFERYNPTVVLTANYGTQPDEIRVLRYAKRCGIETLSLVQSWDNLSSKGVIGAKPDKLIVWNGIMKREAIDLHDFRESDVFLTGAPQFDFYVRKDLIRSRTDFCGEMGLDPTKKIILFGTITPKYFPHNIEIVQILVECIEKGLFQFPCQVVVRLHPQVVDDGIWGDKLSSYLDIEKKIPYVKCDIPRIKRWKTISPPERLDSSHLGELLHYADVCLHPGSTLAIDAAIMDTPIIGIGFDGYQKKDYEDSIRRWYDFTYYSPITKSGGMRIAYDVNSLIEYINLYLNDRALDVARRKRIVDLECDKVDGRAAERIADLILKALKSHEIAK